MGTLLDNQLDSLVAQHGIAKLLYSLAALVQHDTPSMWVQDAAEWIDEHGNEGNAAECKPDDLDQYDW